MNSFLTKEDLTILSRAIELYENEPISNGMMTSIMKAVILGGSRGKDEAAADAEKDIARAQTLSDARRISVARLRVKLLEMAERPTEFAQ